MKTGVLQSETPLWLLLLCQVLLHDFSISLLSLLEVPKLRTYRWKQHMRQSKLFEPVLQYPISIASAAYGAKCPREGRFLTLEDSLQLPISW